MSSDWSLLNLLSTLQQCTGFVPWHLHVLVDLQQACINCSCLVPCPELTRSILNIDTEVSAVQTSELCNQLCQLIELTYIRCKSTATAACVKQVDTDVQIQRDKNHPSIILWSCGNESGFGKAHTDMAKYYRQLDPSRPTHYEVNSSALRRLAMR